VGKLADVVHGPEDQGATIASGSFRTDGMVIVPCSMKTLAGIRTGYAEGLVCRAADVVLKERRKLVLVPRETPLSEIHLENMLDLARKGVQIVPPMPAFYNHPKSVNDIVDHLVVRILDQFDLPAADAKRWGACALPAKSTLLLDFSLERRYPMPYDDLREFLKALDEQGQLLRITDEVMPEPDIAAAANAAPRLGENAPALYFDNVKGFTDARIAMNVHGSWANHALALGLPKETGVKAQVDEFIARWANFPVKPVWRDDPPWAQNTQIGEDVNIFEVLPLIRLNDGDGGFYLDKAAVVSKDPEDPENSGKQNVGIYRIEVKGKRKLAAAGADARHRPASAQGRTGRRRLANCHHPGQRPGDLHRRLHTDGVRPERVRTGRRAARRTSPDCKITTARAAGAVGFGGSHRRGHRGTQA
jgi:polyprenyl P-hydroxybenzoate/phenylacrylic acid decarboxylase-like protein